MKDINSITISGRLTRDAEIQQTTGGISLLRFSIANNRGKKNVKGQWVDQEPNYFNLILFGKLGEKLQQYLVKGVQVVVTGVLQQSRWTDNGGNKKSNIGIIANDVLLVGQKKDSNYNPNHKAVVDSKPLKTYDNTETAFETDVEVPF